MLASLFMLLAGDSNLAAADSAPFSALALVNYTGSRLRRANR
jgi:hypothetical protein